MATSRTGFTDTYHSSRLNHLKNTAYPAALTSAFLALYIGSLPLSDGTGGTEATGTRQAITFGSPVTDGNGRQYIANTSAITQTLTTTAPGTLVGFGIQAASTGGTPVYIDRLPSPFQVAAGASVTIPVGGIKVYAEPKTID
jgi:hypothetical protein